MAERVTGLCESMLCEMQNINRQGPGGNCVKRQNNAGGRLRRVVGTGLGKRTPSQYPQRAYDPGTQDGTRSAGHVSEFADTVSHKQS